MKDTSSWLLAATIAGLPLAAVAQMHAADPAAPAPAPKYRSAFSDYKPWQDAQPADWRAVNEAVRAAAAEGRGHGGHGSEPAAPPAPAASAPPHGRDGGHGDGHGRGSHP